MGASSSRRLSFRDEEPITTLEITHDVLNRLRSHGPPKATAANIEQPIQVSPFDMVNQNMSKHPTAESDPLTLSSEQLKDKKLEELRRNDFVWRSKFKALEIKYRYLSSDQGISEIDELEKLALKKKERICGDTYIKLAACYKKHPTQLLKCSENLQEFKDCVQDASPKSKML